MTEHGSCPAPQPSLHLLTCSSGLPRKTGLWNLIVGFLKPYRGTKACKQSLRKEKGAYFLTSDKILNDRLPNTNSTCFEACVTPSLSGALSHQRGGPCGDSPIVFTRANRCEQGCGPTTLRSLVTVRCAHHTPLAQRPRKTDLLLLTV